MKFNDIPRVGSNCVCFLSTFPSCVHQYLLKLLKYPRNRLESSSFFQFLYFIASGKLNTRRTGGKDKRVKEKAWKELV